MEKDNTTQTWGWGGVPSGIWGPEPDPEASHRSGRGIGLALGGERRRRQPGSTNTKVEAEEVVFQTRYLGLNLGEASGLEIKHLGLLA